MIEVSGFLVLGPSVRVGFVAEQMMLTKMDILGEGLEALTEVDAVTDLYDEQAGQSWFETQVAEAMHELELETDKVRTLQGLVSDLYLGEDDVLAETAINKLLKGKDPGKCLVLCRLLTARMYARGDDRIRTAIETREP